MFITPCKGFWGLCRWSKRNNVLHFILSDNSLKYYFQRTLLMWSNIVNVALPLYNGFSTGVYVDGHIELMFHYHL